MKLAPMRLRFRHSIFDPFPPCLAPSRRLLEPQPEDYNWGTATVTLAPRVMATATSTPTAAATSTRPASASATPTLAAEAEKQQIKPVEFQKSDCSCIGLQFDPQAPEPVISPGTADLQFRLGRPRRRRHSR